MAMFNFEFTDPKEKAAQKPMRSYVDIDENGREQPATPTPQTMPAVPSAFTQRQGQVRIWNPKTSRFEYVPASTWSQNSKNYVAEGAILLP